MIKIDFEEGKICFSPKRVGRSFGSKRKISDFDVEAQGWRSFILDSVKYVKTNLNESV